MHYYPSVFAIFLVEFCFGGYHTVQACKDKALPFGVGLSFHGGQFTPEDVSKLTVPVNQNSDFVSCTLVITSHQKYI